MVEQSKVKEEEAVRVQADHLRSTVTAIFEKMAVTHEDAKLAADVLVTADLRGVDSHGVSNMLSSYVTGYTTGTLNPNPEVRIIRESPSTANVDSDRGLGIITTPKAMEIAIQKAQQTGIGMVTIHNGTHLGMASYHAMMALQYDMIGVCMSSTPPRVLPTFGREPRLGTNPIAIAAPAKEEPPFVLDMATSAVALNKITIARRLGVDLEGGWIADQDGTPIMKPGAAPETFLGLPLGSTRELGSHKGYGLGCMVDILCGMLSGGGFAMATDRSHFKHMVAAYKIDAFTPVDQFKEAMDDFLRTLKDTPPAPGHQRVLYAGLPEDEAEQERRANGIPLHQDVIQWFQTICTELDVPYLLT